FFYADFGLSDQLPCVKLHDKEPKFGQTLWYRAPEIFTQEVGYTFEPDIWALGIVFLEFLTGDLFIDYEEPLQSIYDNSIDGHIDVGSLIGFLPYTNLIQSMLIIDYQARTKITDLIKVNPYPQVNYMPTRIKPNIELQDYKDILNWAHEVMNILELPIFVFIITNDL